MTAHIPHGFSAKFIDWSSFVILGNKIPPRDPDEGDDDDDEKEGHDALELDKA